MEMSHAIVSHDLLKTVAHPNGSGVVDHVSAVRLTDYGEVLPHSVGEIGAA